MTTENTSNEISESELSVIQGANRYYQEVTITGVTGECPYGHKEGDQFKITSMNSDGICGALLKSVFFQIGTLHYGGSLLWDKNPDVSRGCCPEGGKVGDIFEVDTFNVGGACCFLYTQLYPYIHVLMSGSSPPWAWDEHTIIGECPDTYDRLAYRLFVEERK